MRSFFTSDIHFWQRSALRHIPTRPGVDVETMNAALIAGWNAVVTARDEVWHLGDFSFGGANQTAECVGALKFRTFHMLKGNHDDTKRLRKALEPLGRDIQIHDTPYMERKFGGQHVVLCHYGLRVWNRCHYGAFHLYGHSHGNLPPHGRSVDVGVDAPWITGKPEHRPYEWSELKAWMEQREIAVVDHHRPSSAGAC